MPLWQRAALMALVLGLVIGGVHTLPGTPIEAGADFCARDPILQFDGRTTRLITEIPVASTYLVTTATPMRIRVYVPSNVKARLVATTGNFPEQVEFVATSAPAQVGQPMTITFEIYAPDQGGSTAYPVRYKATSQLDTASGQGMSGAWFRGAFLVPH